MEGGGCNKLVFYYMYIQEMQVIKTIKFLYFEIGVI